MRFGICAPPERTAGFADAGYDFIEWPMSRTVGIMDDDAFRSLSDLARTLPITPEAWNVMLPSSIKVVGPEADHAGLKRYIEQAFLRASELGGNVVVFGSGGARAIPDGWPHDEAVRQFDDASRIIGDIAATHGITVAIEPLNYTETNLVNTVSEAAAAVERVNHPSVQLLSDLYHVTRNGEPLSDTGAAGTALAHVHIAEPHSRAIPHANEMESIYREYFGILKRAKYDHLISIECSKPFVEEAAEALGYLRNLWNTTDGDVA